MNVTYEALGVMISFASLVVTVIAIIVTIIVACKKD